MRIVIGGDFDPENENHPATEAALSHAADVIGLDIRSEWVSTEVLSQPERVLADAAGIFLTTGSPYRCLDGALAAIRHARMTGLPFLGTCGGFQHVVLEGFRNVAGLVDAAHGEYDSTAPRQVIAPLACSLRGQTMEVRVEPGSLVANAYGSLKTTERYYCQFGLADTYRDRLSETGLRITATDADGDARVVERRGHPFFMATLFVPQAVGTSSSPHPIITAFLTAAAQR